MHLFLSAVSSTNSATTSVLSGVVSLVVLVLLLVRRARGQPLNVRRILTLAGVITVIGVVVAVSELNTTKFHSVDYVIGGIDLVDSLVLGTVRGFTVRIEDRDGALWYRYGPLTLAFWVVSIVIRVVLIVVGEAHHVSSLIAEGDLLFMLGIMLLCQNLVVAQRSVRLSGLTGGLGGAPTTTI